MKTLTLSLGFLAFLLFSCQGNSTQETNQQQNPPQDSLSAESQAANILAEAVYTQKDSLLCEKLLQQAQNNALQQKPTGEIVVAMGKKLLGTPYVAHTLETEQDEKLVLNLKELDCVTFVETTLALAQCAKAGKTSFEDFARQLKKIRYRNGKIQGYPSRLHYFSDWISDNQTMGLVRNVSRQAGGKKLKKTINFMSQHRKNYQQLDSEKNFRAIRQIEDTINQREIYFLEKNKIENAKNKIKNGDLIDITTKIKGLDAVHTGIIVKREGKIYFMHASSISKQVEITQEPLSDYLQAKHTGIMLARAK